MKIKSLLVSQYKNLRDIDLKFNSNLITLLIGQNGLGKSNLIEILGMIFQSLDLFKTEEEILTWSRNLNQDHFEYKINYECNGFDIFIEVLDTSYTIKSTNFITAEVHDYTFNNFLRNKSKLLPKFIIGYYSGENKRIKQLVYEHEKRSKYNQINYFRRKTKPELNLRRIFFADSHHGKLIFLTLILYKNHVVYGQAITKLFEEYIGEDQFSSFKIVFNNPRSKSYILHEKGINEFENKFFSTREEDGNPFWNLKGKMNKLLKTFYEYGINDSKLVTYQNEGEYIGRHIKEIMELQDIDISIFQEYVSQEFQTPLDFFDALESAQVIDVLTEIEIYAKQNDKTLKFASLSEGQLQLITVMGLILITGNKDCLFLFDEPDTHINPKWQRIFVDILKEFNFNGNDSHIFVATHSPLIVQSYEGNDLFLFKKVNNEVVIDTEDHKIKNWRIDQVLLSEYSNLSNSRPVYLDVFMMKRLEILEKAEISNDDIEELRQYENEFLVLPTGETLNDIKSLQLINKITNRISNDSAQEI